MEKIKLTKKKAFMADMSLFITAIIWGGGFVAVKDALATVTPFYMMSIRFLLSALILGGIFYKRLIKINRKDIFSGSVVGVFLFLGFAAQTIGLQYTTAGKQAFITGLYVIIVPFLVWFLDRITPDKHSIVAAFLAFSGIALLSINDKFQFGMNLGDWLTLMCAFFFAAQIVAVSHYTKGIDPIVLSVVQMAVAGVLSILCAVIFEPSFKGVTGSGFISLFYLVVFSTTIAFLIQNVAQKYAHPNHVGIILCFESVFGAIFSVIFLSEVFTLNMIVGCLVIFVAVILAETKLNFIKFKNNKEKFQ